MNKTLTAGLPLSAAFVLLLSACASSGASVQNLTALNPYTGRQIASDSVEPIKEIFEPAGPPSASGTWDKVAVVQWNPTLPTPVGVTKQEAEKVKQEHRETLAGYIQEAAQHGAKLVITSEFSIVGYPDIPELPDDEDDFRNHDDIRPYVETIPGPSTRYFSKLAKKLGIYLHIGLAEGDPGSDHFHNVVVVIGPDGQIIGHYVKINLYQLEQSFLDPGNDIFTYDSPWGKIGIVVCADVYSDNPMDAYKNAGVDVLALSTSWAQMNTGMSTFRQGAIRDHAYLLAANQTYFPDSGVINPDGSFQSHIRQSTGIAYGYLPRKSGR